MAVGLDGTIRDNIPGNPACQIIEHPNRREPSFGYKKRKSLITKKYTAAPTINRVISNELRSFFENSGATNQGEVFIIFN